MKQLPPFEKLSKFIKYNPNNGLAVWITSPGNQVKINTIAGKINKRTGYVQICFAGEVYAAHRLFWLLQTKNDPLPFQIDHIDKNRLNNKFCNLRLATFAENQRNKSLHRNNTTGCRGVYWVEEQQKYRVKIHFNKACFNLGHYKTFEQAVAVRQAKELELHGKFSPLHQINNDQRLILDDNDQQLSFFRHPGL